MPLSARVFMHDKNVDKVLLGWSISVTSRPNMRMQARLAIGTQERAFPHHTDIPWWRSLPGPEDTTAWW